MNSMEEKTKKNILLASLSYFVAERDMATANILSILESGEGKNSTNYVIEEIKKLSNASSAIETIQMFFAENIKVKEDNKNDDNS